MESNINPSISSVSLVVQLCREDGGSVGITESCGVPAERLFFNLDHQFSDITSTPSSLLSSASADLRSIERMGREPGGTVFI